MTDRLKQNLHTKLPLRFGDNGKFRILQISDIQENLNYDGRTLRDLHRLMDAAKPDLVVLGGDNFDGHVVKTEEELREYLNIFTAPMEERSIPWVHIFGNHDHDCDVDDLQMASLFEEYGHCLSKHTEGIGGTTNFVVPVMHSGSDTVAFNVWGLDSGNRINGSDFEAANGIFDLPVRGTNSDCWDVVRFDQLMWYWNSSVEMEEHCGEKIPGIMFMHIAPWEFQLVVDNPEKTGGMGSMKEHMSLGAMNTGLFATVLQRGDIKAISCGHSHDDCFRGEVCGISLSLDACAGYSPYGTDELRGGRLFVIDEAASQIETVMMHYKDL